jgi:hypothetical protein
MGFKSDVKSTRLAASGSIFAGPARVKGVYVVSSGTAGSITIKDGGADGTTVCTLDTPGAAGMVYLRLPEDGLRCSTNAYAVLANATAATFFYA